MEYLAYFLLFLLGIITHYFVLSFQTTQSHKKMLYEEKYKLYLKISKALHDIQSDTGKDEQETLEKALKLSGIMLDYIIIIPDKIFIELTHFNTMLDSELEKDTPNISSLDTQSLNILLTLREDLDIHKLTKKFKESLDNFPMRSLEKSKNKN